MNRVKFNDLLKLLLLFIKLVANAKINEAHTMFLTK